MAWWVKRMPGNSCLKAGKSRDSIFIRYIFLSGMQVSLSRWRWGDFTVNLGQGLIQWQSLAFKKSADVIPTLNGRLSVLRPL